MLKDFKPALLFLAKFLAIYFIGNLIYGVFIESYVNRPDPITKLVTFQSAEVLRTTGFETNAFVNITSPTVLLKEKDDLILRVYEGCNGINVMIVFVAFLFAFGGPPRTMLWYLPVGILVIHIANLFRIWLLYYTAIYQPRYFYYFHKYFFTAILYFIVFALWAIWVIKKHGKNNLRATAPDLEKH